jgi:Tfp pilus assembly protein PilF
MSTCADHHFPERTQAIDRRQADLLLLLSASQSPHAARVVARFGNDVQKLFDFRKKLRASIIVCLMIGLFPSICSSQVGNRDYYNPGTGTDERAYFRNVHSYHLQPGIEKLMKGQLSAAYQDFEFILDSFPNSPQTLNLMSELCVNRWKSPKCEVDSRFEKAVATNPQIAMTYVLYGMHLHRRGNLDQAAEKLNVALSLSPDSVNAHYNLGLVYFDMKKYELANTHAQQSYALGAEPPGLRNKLVKAGKWHPLAPSETAARGSPNIESFRSEPPQ